jgi:hypothetical protein
MAVDSVVMNACVQFSGALREKFRDSSKRQHSENDVFRLAYHISPAAKSRW